jgi:hypothetical protein
VRVVVVGAGARVLKLAAVQQPRDVAAPPRAAAELPEGVLEVELWLELLRLRARVPASEAITKEELVGEAVGGDLLLFNLSRSPLRSILALVSARETITKEQLGGEAVGGDLLLFNLSRSSLRSILALVCARTYEMRPCWYSFSAASMVASAPIRRKRDARFCISTVASGTGRHRFWLRPSVFCTTATPSLRQLLYSASADTLSKRRVRAHVNEISLFGFSGFRSRMSIEKKPSGMNVSMRAQRSTTKPSVGNWHGPYDTTVSRLYLRRVKS